jgi:hypothetical protein
MQWQEQVWQAYSLLQEVAWAQLLRQTTALFHVPQLVWVAEAVQGTLRISKVCLDGVAVSWALELGWMEWQV